MKRHGQTQLLGLLVLAILINLIAWRFSDDSPAYSNKNSADEGKDILITQAMSGDQSERNGKFSLADYNLDTKLATRWKLPLLLQEISGLAMTPDNRLWGHNDEKGIIFELDIITGGIVKAFAMSDYHKAIVDDFEGIAVADSHFYLVTSSGRIYECEEGKASQAVFFTLYATGVGRDFEIEGLAYSPSNRTLLLMGKNPRKKALKDQIMIYSWSIDTKMLVKNAHITIPTSHFSRHLKSNKFQPSGIERHPDTGNYFIVAARQRAIAEITPAGQVLMVRELPKWHHQSEGIAFSANGSLIISDEGSKKRARLTLYPPSE